MKLVLYTVDNNRIEEAVANPDRPHNDIVQKRFLDILEKGFFCSADGTLYPFKSLVKMKLEDV